MQRAPFYICLVAAGCAFVALLVGCLTWSRASGPLTTYLAAVGAMLALQSLLPNTTARSAPHLALRFYISLQLLCSFLLLLSAISGGLQSVYWWCLIWLPSAAVLAANCGWPDWFERALPWLVLQPGGVIGPHAAGYSTLEMELATRETASLQQDNEEEPDAAASPLHRRAAAPRNSRSASSPRRYPGTAAAGSKSERLPVGPGGAQQRSSIASRCLVVLTLLGSTFLSPCLTFQGLAAAVDTWSYPPPGRLVAVVREELPDNAPGRVVRMHLHCQGPPPNPQHATFVLESGMSSNSAALRGLAAALAAGGRRACAYDRLGNGWSAPVAPDYQLLEAPELLVGLLRAAGERGPFIFVGHGMGGGLMQVLAIQESDMVAGLVLLDAVSPFNGSLTSSASQQQAQRGASQLSLWRSLAPLGWHRGLTTTGTAGYPWRGAMRAVSGRTDIFTTMAREWNCLTCADQRLTADADLPPYLGDVSWPRLPGSRPVLVVVSNGTAQLPAACPLQPYTTGYPPSRLQASNCTEQLLRSTSGPTAQSVGRGNPAMRQALLYNSTLSRNSKLLVCPDEPERQCNQEFPWTHPQWLAAVMLARFAGT